jgi:selenocysteine lyase/cysteine desulfurase
MAGATAAVHYIASVGRRFGAPASEGLRAALVAGMETIQTYERELTERLIAGLQKIKRLEIYGITDPEQFDTRMPVVSFTLPGLEPGEIARRLGDRAIFLWSGHFYAVHAIERLGLTELGGVVRVGLNHYNTVDEVDRLLEAVGEIAS